jgi:hypothetical protein
MQDVFAKARVPGRSMAREETVGLARATYAAQQIRPSRLVENGCPTAYSLKEQLDIKPYMLQRVQAINEDDNEVNFTFCGEFLNSTFCLLHAGFMLGSLLKPKDGGHTFRNVA